MTPFIRLTLTTVAIACIPLTIAFSSYAQSGDRTEQLEKEIRDIKLRLSNLEAAQGKQAASPKPGVSPASATTHTFKFSNHMRNRVGAGASGS